MTGLRSCVSAMLIAALAAACTGDDGPAGPEGPGGNANVMMYEFGSRTFAQSTNYIVPVSQATMDSSMVLLYYNPSTEATTAWYPVPGLGPASLYEARFFTFQSSPSEYTFGVRLNVPGGTSSYSTAVTFRKMRIFVVPASSIVSLTSTSAGLDLGDYDAVRRSLPLPD